MNGKINKILETMVGINVVVTMPSNALEGELIAVDPHGIMVRVDDPKSTDEIPEQFAIFVPHKNVEMVHAQENNNLTSLNEDNYNKLFGEA